MRLSLFGARLAGSTLADKRLDHDISISLLPPPPPPPGAPTVTFQVLPEVTHFLFEMRWGQSSCDWGAPGCMGIAQEGSLRSMGADCDKVILIAAMGPVFESRLRKSVRSALFRGVRLGSHNPLGDRVPRGA